MRHCFLRQVVKGENVGELFRVVFVNTSQCYNLVFKVNERNSGLVIGILGIGIVVVCCDPAVFIRASHQFKIVLVTK